MVSVTTAGIENNSWNISQIMMISVSAIHQFYLQLLSINVNDRE